MSDNTDISIRIPDGLDMVDILGLADSNLKCIQDSFESRISVRGNVVTVSGLSSETEAISSLFASAIKRAQDGNPATQDDIQKMIELLRGPEMSPKALKDDVVLSYKGRAIRPKTAGQKKYIDAIRKNTVTFGIGPAGTGKTYLAMALALSALKHKEVGRIILSRPIVEAGENLGFLPGTLTEKVDPYIRPLYDALFSMSDAERAQAYLESGVIEIAPLAFMRGRTLNDSFIILDEAQNTTPEQMKMALTRLGEGSKMVVTGDITQADIPISKSGLTGAEDILGGIDGIEFCRFSGRDVVRNSLVRKIIAAYEKHFEASL